MTSQQSSGIAAAAAEDELPGDLFSGAVHTLEYTLAQVNEQIETLNLFLEELSRQYLGDDTGGESLFLEYYYQDEEYRGQVVTDECGRYNFSQAFPALYPTRPILHDHFRTTV